MTRIEDADPERAKALIEAGYVCVDVRSEPEFEAGHIPGSLNVPLMHRADSGMVANPEFLDVVQQVFSKTDRLLLSCRSGARSRRAAEMLVQAGYTQLADLVTGWEGSRDAFGRPTPGWSKLALPVETGAPAGQSYADVKRRAQSS